MSQVKLLVEIAGRRENIEQVEKSCGSRKKAALFSGSILNGTKENCFEIKI
jgi:hypothetical protein